MMWRSRLRRWREELQRDVVGIAERESRTVRGVDDAAVLNGQLVELRLPLLQLIPTAAGESDMVQARPALVEPTAEAILAQVRP